MKTGLIAQCDGSRRKREIFKEKKASLKGKFGQLNAEKILFEELFHTNEIKKIQKMSVQIQ